MSRHLLGIVFAMLAGAGALAAEHPTAHERAAIAAADGHRPWLHEDEFAREPGLRARPDQVVVVPLASAPRDRRFVRHVIPYQFSGDGPYRFCIRDGDPALRDLELVSEQGDRRQVHLRPGDSCQTIAVAPGPYRLELWHDGAGLEDGGRTAFLHVGQAPEPATTAPALGTTPCDASAYNNPMTTFTGPDGKFLNVAISNNTQIVGTTTADLTGGWSFCPDAAGNVTLQSQGLYGLQYVHGSGPPGTNSVLTHSTAPQPLPFVLTNLSNGQFTLAANFSGSLYPVVVGSDGALHWADQTSSPTPFTVQATYNPAQHNVAPVAGQIAFGSSGCGEKDEGNFVMNASVPNLGVYTLYAIALEPLLKSFQPGPNTQAVLFSASGYTGGVVIGGAPIACLSSTPASFQITSYRDYLAATDECTSCNLSGLDLSGLMLAGGRFQSSTFTGANLTGTNLQSASLDHANFVGQTTVLANTNMLGAVIRCSNFSGADLSTAAFQASGIVLPIVTSDFSCTLNLSGATLKVATFPLQQWRYFNLDGANVTDVVGATLSTSSSKLDLSGAILTNMNLAKVVLDGANLGCATTSSGPVCTKLTGISLNGASLRGANMVGALLQGANLGAANLDSANLCSANLSESGANVSATLQGAYMRNVNLAYAYLTGANLAHSNFYSTLEKSCVPTASCGATSSCASAASATLNNASFNGAYLAGADFSSSTPQGVDFSSAYLAGATMTKANLSADPKTGKRTDFTGAYLQGVNFGAPNVSGADFTNATIATASGSGSLLSQLDPSKNITFPGYTPAPGSILGCVQFSYNTPTTVPPTDASNLCPDGFSGPCTATNWSSPKVPPPAVPDSCTAKTADGSWFIH